MQTHTALSLQPLLRQTCWYPFGTGDLSISTLTLNTNVCEDRNSYATLNKLLRNLSVGREMLGLHQHSGASVSKVRLNFILTPS